MARTAMKAKKGKGGDAKGGAMKAMKAMKAMCGKGVAKSKGCAKGKGGAKGKDKGKTSGTFISAPHKDEDKQQIAIHFRTLSGEQHDVVCYGTDTISKVKGSLPIDYVTSHPHDIVIMQRIESWRTLADAQIKNGSSLFVFNQRTLSSIASHLYERRGNLFTMLKGKTTTETDKNQIVTA
jgi:hypothetical protein